MKVTRSKLLGRNEVSLMLNCLNNGVKRKSNRRDTLAILIMYRMGLRVGELCKLNLSNYVIIDGEAYLQIRDAKWGSDRDIPVPRSIASLLNHTVTDRYLDGGYYDSPIIASGSGRRMHPQHYRRLITRLAREAGINRRVYPHMLRHTCATELLEEGCNVVTVKQVLGHRNISTTDAYLHASDKLVKIAMNER